jgi:hypothetical protein
MNRSYPAMLYWAALLSIFVWSRTSSAYVDQTVEAEMHLQPFFAGVPEEEARDLNLAIGVTSADITTDILAQVDGATMSNGFVYQAHAAAGRFGSVGVGAVLLGGAAEPDHMMVSSSVTISSDEFVNLLGTRQRAVANFIIDGGFILMDSTTNAWAEYRLTVGASNLGNVDITVPPDDLPSGDLIDVFRSSGRMESDAAGTLQFIPGRFEDIGVTFDSAQQRLEIPFSLHSLDLRIVEPGDRLVISYFFDFELRMGTGEAIVAEFADPLNLAARPVFEVEFLPVPEPAALALATTGTAVILARRKGRGWE